MDPSTPIPDSGGSGSPGSGATPYNSRQASSYPRRRAGRACAVCRSRKTKCDNQRPSCGFCNAIGADCRYPDDETTNLSQLDRGTLAILQRLSDVEKNLAKLYTEHQPPHLGLSAGVSTAPAPMRDTAAMETDSTQSDDNQPPTAQIILEAAEMTVENISVWPILSLGQVPALVPILAGRGQINQPSGETIFDLDNETVMHLVDNFLSNNHVKNPIFDVNELWNQVQECLDRGLGWDGTSCLVLLICAVSVLSPPIDKELRPGFSKRADRLARGEMFFQASQRRIGMIYHDNSLLGIQCSFLTAVYLMSTYRILAAWKTFSQAGTQCLGWLTARGSAAEGPSHVEESLYWSCLKSELELRSELGLPGSSLNEMRYPHVYPSPPGMDVPLRRPIFMVESVGSPSDQGRDDLERGWFFYLAEIALRRIVNDALSKRYQQESWYFSTQWWTEGPTGGFSSHIEEFKQKLEAWYETLPPPMRFARDPQINLRDALRGILRGHLIDILDVLYFPAVKAVATKPLDEISPSVLKAAVEGLRTAVDRVTICREGFWHRHQGTWIMSRTCSRSALQLLAVAMRARAGQENEQGVNVAASILPDEWREAVLGVTELLDYWKDESPDLVILLARLRHCLEKTG